MKHAIETEELMAFLEGENVRAGVHEYDARQKPLADARGSLPALRARGRSISRQEAS